MSYHRNGHGLIERIEETSNRKEKKEYYLKPGQGVLFYKLGKPLFGDKYEIYRKAEKAARNNLMELFAVVDEEIGLMLAPSLNPQHAATAFINYAKHVEKRTAEVLNPAKTLIYRGILITSHSDIHI